ncbi:EspF repeat-containing protein [Variovorax sp. SG517]|uniref:EspF repeat-containing protein n=1 Tax=Variovorax sp. SG517 TaxID=2587117 RepID=UPI003523FDAF
MNRRHFPPIQQSQPRPLPEVDRRLVHFTSHIARDALHAAVVVDDLHVRDRTGVADIGGSRRQRCRTGSIVDRIDPALA